MGWLSPGIFLHTPSVGLRLGMYDELLHILVLELGRLCRHCWGNGVARHEPRMHQADLISQKNVQHKNFVHSLPAWVTSFWPAYRHHGTRVCKQALCLPWRHPPWRPPLCPLLVSVAALNCVLVLRCGCACSTLRFCAACFLPFSVAFGRVLWE